MADSHDQNNENVILQFANDAVVTHSIPPAPHLITQKRMTELTGIFCSTNLVSQETSDEIGGRLIELG